MSGVNELLALAEYDRNLKREAAMPAEAFTQGYVNNILMKQEEKRRLDETNTNFSKLLQVLGNHGDYQNKYTIKPTINNKGDIGYSLSEKSDADRFSEAVQGNMPTGDLYRNFPQYADKIYELQRQRVIPMGNAIQPYTGTPIQKAGQVAGDIMSMNNDAVNRINADAANPVMTNADGSNVELEPTEFDALGMPKGFKIKKPSVEEQKFKIEQEENKRIQEQSAQTARESAQATLDTIAEIEKGIKYFGAMGNAPGWTTPLDYDRQNWLANYNTLKDKLVVDLMLKLKSASKTGATGFGQLSEKEGQRLENAATALQKGMKESDAQRYLNQIKESAQKILNSNQSNTSSPSVSQQDFQTKIDAARQAGYTDQEIQAYLNGEM